MKAGLGRVTQVLGGIARVFGGTAKEISSSGSGAADGDSGLRPGDAVSLARNAIKPGRLHLRTAKTSVDVNIPLPPETLAALDAYFARD